jgi:F-type H+-transporting ATPase subunit O
MRTYATAIKGAKPPIAIHTLEGTYASALFSAASQSNAVLNEIEKSLSKIRQKLDTDSALQSVVVNPTLSHLQKLDVIKLLTQIGGGGPDATNAIRNLLEVLSENGRLGQLGGVVGAFERIMRAHQGEVEVVVTSAQV